MSETRPPALTNKIRSQIESMIKVGEGVPDRLTTDTKGDDFRRVYSVGLENLLTVGKIELAYKQRFIQATQSKDTALMLAAVYGLHLDIRGPIKPAAPDREFENSFMMRALSIVSEKEIRSWLADANTTFSRGVNLRRALVEYLDEKLVVLDGLVAEAYPKKDPIAETETPAPAM